MESLLDRRFQHIALSKYNEEIKARKLKQSLKELMEMYTSEEIDISIAPTTPINKY